MVIFSNLWLCTLQEFMEDDSYNEDEELEEKLQQYKSEH